MNLDDRTSEQSTWWLVLLNLDDLSPLTQLAIISSIGLGRVFPTLVPVSCFFFFIQYGNTIELTPLRCDGLPLWDLIVDVNSISCTILYRLTLHFINTTEMTCKQSGVVSRNWHSPWQSMVGRWKPFLDDSFLKAILVSGSAYSLLDSQKDVPGRDAPFISMAKFDSEMGGRTESPSCLYITVVQDIKVCTKYILLLMEEILHQLISSLSHYLQGFIYLTTLRILTPPMETPDPPNDTPGALKQLPMEP